MAKSKGQLKTTRLFSLQLADHDTLFAPRQRRRLPFHWLKLLLYLPALALFFLPSFKIGRAVLREPGFKIPDSVERGDVFTIPASDKDDIVPHVAGHALAYVDTKTPFYLGAALQNSDLEINVAFHDEQSPPFKRIVEKLKHPTYPLFVKHVHVTQAEPVPVSPAPASVKGRATTALPEERKPPLIDAKEAKVLARFDGNVRLRCWKEPTVEPLGIDPLKPRRHNFRLGSLPAVAGGEVLYTGPSENDGGLIVLVYHGGGLFTRYWGLKEVRVQKGSKISVGQTVGNVLLAPPRHETKPTWQPLLNVGGTTAPVNPASVLALTSQLCDSK